MLSAEGCRERRQRLWQRLQIKPDGDFLLLGDPVHLTYFANFIVDPISSVAGFGGYLLIRKDGQATLFHDNRMPHSADQAHVDETKVVVWYDGQSPARCPRELTLLDALPRVQGTLRVHDRLGDPMAPALIETIATMRRQKDPDEMALLRQCMRAGEAGHAWGRKNIKAGMTELNVYGGVSAACIDAAKQAVVVYGDFAVSPGPERRGGGPTDRVLKPGDMIILDFSVVIEGYRGDFTNTLVVGSEPNPGQQRLYQSCVAAMDAGEKQLRALATCQTVYDAVRGAFEKLGMAEHFPHHAGHGLGLSHPENPYLVRHSTETLLPGDVVTLEPGVYVTNVGGIRIENNYLITEIDFERLSNHLITLK